MKIIVSLMLILSAIGSVPKKDDALISLRVDHGSKSSWIQIYKKEDSEWIAAQLPDIGSYRNVIRKEELEYIRSKILQIKEPSRMRSPASNFNCPSQEVRFTTRNPDSQEVELDVTFCKGEKTKIEKNVRQIYELLAILIRK